MSYPNRALNNPAQIHLGWSYMTREQAQEEHKFCFASVCSYACAVGVVTKDMLILVVFLMS